MSKMNKIVYSNKFLKEISKTVEDLITEEEIKNLDVFRCIQRNVSSLEKEDLSEISLFMNDPKSSLFSVIMIE